jgi:MOSC domain-containing protein YiiM
MKELKEISASVVSVHSGDHDDLHKGELESVVVDAEGFPGDGHRGFTRKAWQGDKDPEGTVRRNERQWSGVSAEELAIISRRMDLGRPLEAATLGANLCVEGIPEFSQLPRGSRLLFPSGAVLAIEESNPPCAEMAAQIEAAYTTSSGEPAVGKMFGKHSFGLRGVVGVVDVAGEIRKGDRVRLEVPKSAASS